MRDLIGVHAVQMLPGRARVVDLVEVAGVEEVLLHRAERLLIDEGGLRGALDRDALPLLVQGDELSQPDVSLPGHADRAAGDVVVDVHIMPFEDVRMALLHGREGIAVAAVGGIFDLIAAHADAGVKHQPGGLAAVESERDLGGPALEIDEALRRVAVAQVRKGEGCVKQREQRHQAGVQPVEAVFVFVVRAEPAAPQIRQLKEEDR